MHILLIALRLLIFVAIFMAAYYLAIYIYDNKLTEKVKVNIDKASKNYEKRLSRLRYRKYYNSANKKKNYINNLDILIQKSNVRRFTKVITAETLIVISAIFSIISATYTFLWLYNILAAAVLGIFVYFVPQYILRIIAHHNATKVDNMLIHYVGILKNFCTIKEDITYAIANTAPYLREPLKSFNVTYVNEVSHGITVDEALDNLKNKVDNSRFKQLIKNLQLCNKYKGRYYDVLDKSQKNLKSYKLEKDKRKKAADRTRSALIIMVFLGVVIVVGLMNMNPQLVIELKRNVLGQIIVLYNVIILLFTLYQSLTLEKFDY